MFARIMLIVALVVTAVLSSACMPPRDAIYCSGHVSGIC